jgi:hypothetical protein
VSFVSIPHQPVKSSSITSVGYHAPTRTLEVEFTHGARRYRYHDVPPEAVEALLKADSIGAHFHVHIKPRYTFTRVEN